MANGYLGSDKIKTSLANEEVVPKAPENWTMERYLLYKFSFINYDSTTVKINGGEPIYLKAEQGFESNENDTRIDSFIIVDSGVRYSWIGAY